MENLQSESMFLSIGLKSLSNTLERPSTCLPETAKLDVFETGSFQGKLFYRLQKYACIHDTKTKIWYKVRYQTYLKVVDSIWISVMHRGYEGTFTKRI